MISLTFTNMGPTDVDLQRKNSVLSIKNFFSLLLITFLVLSWTSSDFQKKLFNEEIYKSQFIGRILELRGARDEDDHTTLIESKCTNFKLILFFQNSVQTEGKHFPSIGQPGCIFSQKSIYRTKSYQGQNSLPEHGILSI